MRGDPGIDGALHIEFGVESLVLLPDRAVWWPARGVLFIADVHLGKPASFRDAGAPVPEAVTASDLDRIGALLGTTGARQLVVLGDLVHDEIAWRERTVSALQSWRDRYASLTLTLVRGNHDRRASDPPEALRIDAVDPGQIMGPFALHHEQGERAGGTPVLCGHVHPAVRLQGARKGTSLRAPCFWVSNESLMLPAFGSFTGCALIKPLRGDRVFTVGDRSVVEVTISGTSRVGLHGKAWGRGA